MVIFIFSCIFSSRLWKTFLRNTLYFLSGASNHVYQRVCHPVLDLKDETETIFDFNLYSILIFFISTCQQNCLCATFSDPVFLRVSCCFFIFLERISKPVFNPSWGIRFFWGLCQNEYFFSTLMQSDTFFLGAKC